jgi:hypothetical protein
MLLPLHSFSLELLSNDSLNVVLDDVYCEVADA